MSLEVSTKSFSLSNILKSKFRSYITKVGVKPNTIIFSADYKYSKSMEDSITKLRQKGYKIIYSYEIKKKSIVVTYIPDLILKDEEEEQLPF